ncbi:membrane protein [Persicobacter diffluens]|uniref:Membrane protein n=2 Tax=Persicobacter diffluens TaxID=981 RepID=A0AAN4VW97_9BACT|nr:membrane protein [Persicobacter diffluens]
MHKCKRNQQKPIMKNINPTSANQRVAVIDALRGFAILGILFANILSWSGYKFIPSSTYDSLRWHELDSYLSTFLSVFIDTKFYTIFSLLFGVGFYFQFRKYKEDQGPFIKTYKRRLWFLFLFGFIHMIFWSGDILMLYALMGFVFIQFRNLSSDNILKYSLILLMSSLVVDVVLLYVAPGWGVPETHLAKKTYIDMSPEAVTAAFQSGSWVETLKMNWHNVLWRWFDFIPSGRPMKVLGLFLLGFFLAEQNFFTTSALKMKNFWKFFIPGLALTLIGKYAIGGSMGEVPSQWSDIAYKAVEVPGQVLLSLSYVCMISIIFESKFGQAALQGLTDVGRMSFTNYLSHTIFGIIFFYGVGFGYFGAFSLTEIWVIAVIFYVAQIAFSKIWQRTFAFGPLEWIWRCLTYKNMFPIRRKTIAAQKAMRAAQKAA